MWIDDWGIALSKNYKAKQTSRHRQQLKWTINKKPLTCHAGHQLLILMPKGSQTASFFLYNQNSGSWPVNNLRPTMQKCDYYVSILHFYLLPKKLILAHLPWKQNTWINQSNSISGSFITPWTHADAVNVSCPPTSKQGTHRKIWNLIYWVSMCSLDSFALSFDEWHVSRKHPTFAPLARVTFTKKIKSNNHASI